MRPLLAIFIMLLLSACTLSANNRLKVQSNLTDPEQIPALAFQADQQFGKKLSNLDRRNLSEAEKKALDFGKPGEETAWNGAPQSAVIGTIQASAFFRVGRSNCRQFQHVLKDGTTTQTVKGTACKRDDGTWRLVS